MSKMVVESNVAIVVVHVVVTKEKLDNNLHINVQTKKKRVLEWEHTYFHIWISLLIIF